MPETTLEDRPVRGLSPQGPPGGQPPVSDDLDALTNPPAGLVKDLTDLERRRVADDGRMMTSIDGAVDRDRARVQKAFDAEGIEPGTMQPWDADRQREKFHHDPVEAFGSIGSVFAMVASAFTHQPMENALNAGAAAMNAIKTGDDQGYERAFDAWKQNNDLAYKRHQIQHESYGDAIRLMDTDMSAGKAKMLMLAAKYGDQKSLFLMEHGLDKDLIDLQEKRNKAALDSQKAIEGITKSRLQRDMLEKDPQWNSNDPDPIKRAGYRLAAFDRIYHVQGTPQQEIMGKWFHQYTQASAEEAAEFYNENFGWAARPKSAEQAFVQMTLERDDIDEPEKLKQIQEYRQRGGGAGGNPNLTIDRQNAAEVVKFKEKLRADGVPEDEIARRGAQEYARLRAASTPPSGNRRDQMLSQITRFNVSDQTIDKVEALLKKHNALTGLGGSITRPGEVVSNWFGSSGTDRAQFRTYIEELRELGPRLINEANSRPLSAEEKRIAAIVPGLDPGDTTQNTAKRLLELKQLFKKLKGDLTQRYEGNASPESLGSNPPTERAGVNNLRAADSALHLTPQERALYQRHLTNLSGSGGVDNSDGSRSTLFQMSFERDGKTYNIPTVWDGKILSSDQAIKRAEREGLDKFPAYSSEAEAEERYQKMHDFMERDTAAYMSGRSSQRAPIPDGDRWWEEGRPVAQ